MRHPHRDPATLQAIAPETVRAYLERTGWTDKGTLPGVDNWTYTWQPEPDAVVYWSVRVPLDVTRSDYWAGLSDVIWRISIVEDRCEWCVVASLQRLQRAQRRREG